MPDEGKGAGPNRRAKVEWKAAEGNGTTVTKYVVRWNGGSRTVDAPATSLDLSNLDNGTAYRFTVEARNGFAADGGVSKQSEQSNSVTPYTTPDKPTVSGSNGKCTSASKCPVTVKANAGGYDGGVGGKTLQVRINGGSWQDSGTSYSKTFQVKSGGNVKIEARVKNGKGLVSGAVPKTQKAQKYTPPAPRVAGEPNWGSTNDASGADGCSSQRCTYFTLDFENLEPGKTYKVEYKNTHPGTKSYGVWASFEITADSKGKARSPQYHYGYWKETGNPNDVFVEGKKIDSFYSP
jgi:hypothetical protein